MENQDSLVSAQDKPRGATLFDDRTSNVSWTYNTARRMGSNISKGTWLGQYFEGNNYYVYIHGKDDPEGEWWRDESKYKKFRGQGGVLVNCHFDSYVKTRCCISFTDNVSAFPPVMVPPTMVCPACRCCSF